MIKTRKEKHYTFKGFDLTEQEVLVMAKDYTDQAWKGPYRLLCLNPGSDNYFITTHLPFRKAKIPTPQELMSHYLKDHPKLLELVLSRYDEDWNGGRIEFDFEGLMEIFFDWEKTNEDYGYWQSVHEGNRNLPEKKEDKLESLDFYGALVRHDSWENDFEVASYVKNELSIYAGGIVSEVLLKECTFSFDGGKTWIDFDGVRDRAQK